MTQTSETETYNGWTNRETWAFVLWVDNDPGTYEQAREIVATATDPAQALSEFADSLFTYDGYTDEYGGDVWPADFARAANDIGSLWRIDFREAAESWAEESA